MSANKTYRFALVVENPETSAIDVIDIKSFDFIPNNIAIIQLPEGLISSLELLEKSGAGEELTEEQKQTIIDHFSLKSL